MSIYKNGKLVAGGSQALPLLCFMWSDHRLNHPSWLNSTTFSWQSGAVYQAAYQHLADDIDGKTLQSETVSGTTIQFYLADDGHKICPASQESNVTAIYNATGVAWYYIIDTTNQRFKLPRTKFGFTGLRDDVGNYVAPGAPNITGSFHLVGDVDIDSVSGAYTMSGSRSHDRGANSGVSGNATASFSAQNSNSIYGNSTTVQPPATQMYLYFYVGNFTQTALENTAGLNAELFNNKVDIGHQVIAFQAPTAGNNYTWYRLYADGWVEQGGIVTIGSLSDGAASSKTATLSITMADSDYQVLATATASSSSYSRVYANFGSKTTKTVGVGVRNIGGSTSGIFINWQVSGMAAS